MIYLKAVKRVNPKCSHHKGKSTGLAWWPSDKDPTCQCMRHGFDPWSWKIPHAAEQLSPCASTVEPVLWSPGTTDAEPMSHNY